MSPEVERQETDAVHRAHMIILALLELVMAGQLVLLIMRGEWPAAILVAATMAILLAPVVFKLPVEIPTEVEIVAVLFIFATLFLGEVRGYYERFWWWDMALHTSSGLLLGMLGFMFVYMLNENDRVDFHMRPSFVALFAFFFAVGMGAIWEIAEYAIDLTFGTNMQPKTPGDPGGLIDTMKDLIVDTVGAAIVSVAGWWYLSRPRESRVDDWASRFVRRNKQMFGD
jgi:hypothetical protein